MKLVSSNDENVAKDTVRQAIVKYRKHGDVQNTVNEIATLKGIGPATASLLLSVHDPTKVIFFSDEAFYWLCNDGKQEHLKYTGKEYSVLQQAAGSLGTRLKASATDIEKVAYVLMKQEAGDRGLTNKGQMSTAKDGKTGTSVASSAKRKTSSAQKAEASKDEPRRRSKRVKA